MGIVKGIGFVLFAMGISSNFARADWLVQYYKTPDGTKIHAVRRINKKTTEHVRRLRSIPTLLSEDKKPTNALYRETLYPDDALPEALKGEAEKTKLLLESLQWPGAEMRKLIVQGPTANRINLTMVGDGYTMNEKEKFFEDVARMTKDLFTGQTFASYLPLFNVSAVFVPSKESGLSDRKKKDTALGLYRDPVGSKRAIMPGDRGAINRAIELAPATDYPILVANDDYYGGLGGQYAITTRSVRSGNVVLRHELGHNFGQVGEEYDNGYVYSGANFSSSKNVPWDYWANGGVKINQVQLYAGEYVWHELSKSPYTMDFDFPKAASGPGYLFHVLISAVGWATPQDVEVLLDGAPVPLHGEFTEDRSFFKIGPTQKLAPGRHRLEYREKIHDHDNVLAFSEVYALADDYNFSQNAVGAYTTFDDSGAMVGYRPTHDSCLMRNMDRKHFCAIDQENMWGRFLQKVDLIDGVEVKADRTVMLLAPNLNGLSIRWYRVSSNGSEVESEPLRGLRTWKAEAGLTGSFRVRVRFDTPEVRKPSSRFVSKHDFKI